MRRKPQGKGPGLRTKFLSDRSGSAAAEYAMILALVAATLMGAFMHISKDIRNVGASIASALRNGGSGG
jgi:Flp pilus assembly pilin Flp